MSGAGKKKTGKSKQGTEPSDKSSKASNQPDITQYFGVPSQDTETIDKALPEGALPSPDDAALPCSTRLGRRFQGSIREQIDRAIRAALEGVEENHHYVLREEAKIKVHKKKKTKEIRNHQLTEFFPVRRSNRKPLPLVVKEKQKEIEEALLSGNEDGFEIKEFPGKGRGVVSKMPIKKGEFVLEYHGELISPEEAKEREKTYSSKENTGCYMYYFSYSDKKYCVDATEESGRLGRLINHSKKGNLRTQPIYAEDAPRLAFFAARDIEAGEELCYDYGDRRKVALESHPWLAL